MAETDKKKLEAARKAAEERKAAAMRAAAERKKGGAPAPAAPASQTSASAPKVSADAQARLEAARKAAEERRAAAMRAAGKTPTPSAATAAAEAAAKKQAEEAAKKKAEEAAAKKKAAAEEAQKKAAAAKAAAEAKKAEAERKKFAASATAAAAAFDAMQTTANAPKSPRLGAVIDAAKKVKYPPFHEVIRIPFGTAGGAHFELELTPGTPSVFGLLAGQSGSGKTSALHTILLGAASRYAPDEVRFVVADFKSMDGASFDYDAYRQVKGKNNLYLPHVEVFDGDADDFLAAIELCKEERTEQLMQSGCRSFREYNRSLDVQNGTSPKMPHVFYVAEEYSRMFSGADNFAKAQKMRDLEALLRSLRSLGIGVLLCGQYADDNLRAYNVLDQMATRIALKNDDVSDYAVLMNTSRAVAAQDTGYLTAKGLAIVSHNAATVSNDPKRRQVVVAFADEAERLKLAADIRGASKTQSVTADKAAKAAQAAREAAEAKKKAAEAEAHAREVAGRGPAPVKAPTAQDLSAEARERVERAKRAAEASTAAIRAAEEKRKQSEAARAADAAAKKKAAAEEAARREAAMEDVERKQKAAEKPASTTALAKNIQAEVAKLTAGQSIVEQLELLKRVYETEKQERESLFRTAITVAETALKATEGYDYVGDYVQTYEVSLGTLENLYQGIVDTQAATRGLRFRVADYIGTVEPRAIAHGGVEDHFEMLVGECRSALAATARSTTPEEDVEPLEMFCQGLVDLRYIVDNARKLATDTGMPAEEKKNAVASAKAVVETRRQEYTAAMQNEAFFCYEAMMNLRTRVKQNAQAVQGMMLGGDTPLGGNDDMRFLMGFYTSQMPAAAVSFAKDVLELTDEDLSVNPIFFELGPDHSNILINAPTAFFKKAEFKSLLQNIYLTFLGGMPAKGLQLAGGEASNAQHVLGGISQLVLSLENAMYGDALVGGVKKEDRQILDTLHHISENVVDARMDIYSSKQDVADIFSYNATVAENRDKFLMFVLNYYPFIFKNTREDGVRQFLETFGDNASMAGVISVICQATDSPDFTEFRPMLDANAFCAERVKADCIAIAEDGSVTYNGQPASLAVRAPTFNLENYISRIQSYFKSANALWLKDVLAKAETYAADEARRLADQGKTPPDFTECIRIPLGNSDGSHYELELGTCETSSFGLIVGSSGSGKSSFLHTLILSAASRYAPDELRFALVDFKAAKDSPEFSQYRYRPGEQNLYIPHVDYLMVNGKADSAFDLFAKIDAMKVERGEMFAQLEEKCSSLSQYNRSPEVRSGKLPKMPVVIFIIDEYNVMMNCGGSNAMRTQLAKKIGETVRSVRAYGIGFFLSGQSVADGLSGGEGGLAQMATRIALKNGDQNDYATLMNVNMQNAKDDMQFITDKGFAIITTDGLTPNSGKRRKVRTAFSGSTGCKWQREQAERIRQKYKDMPVVQIEAGSDELFPISGAAPLAEAPTQVPNAFTIPIGVASASMLRTGLEFSGKGSLNYFAFAGTEKLYAIERNAMFGYLAKMAETHGADTPNVSFLALPAEARACLSSYMEANDFLEDRIDVLSKHRAMADEIVRLYDLMQERKAAIERDEAVDLTPRLMVLHNVDWLREDGSSWLPKKQPAAVAAAPTVSEADQEKLEAMVAKLVASGIKETTARTIANRKLAGAGGAAAAPAAAAAETRFFTIEDYRERLGKLYSVGNLYGIYLLVGSETSASLKHVLFSATDEKNTAYEYAVYNASREYEEQLQQRHHGAIPSCAYVCPGKANVRLFDYDPEENADWWRALAAKFE